MRKSDSQLEMPIGTAANKLRKAIMFKLIRRLGENFCYQCGDEIQSVDELSIEHKIPWLDSDDPVALFFDLNNIGFSHLICNSRAARQTRKMKHPSQNAYAKGCRCDGCKEAHKVNNKSWRKKARQI